MTGWLILAGYLLGWLLAARAVMTFAANDKTMIPETPMDSALLTILACLIAMFWPLFLPALLVAKTRRRSPRELKRDLAERDRRIAKLERELGIGKETS